MNNIVKSVVFAAVVLFAGIAAMQVIYKNQDATSDITAVEPAAGEAMDATAEGAPMGTQAQPVAGGMTEDAADEAKEAIDAQADATKEAIENQAEAQKDAAEAAKDEAAADADAADEAADAQKEAADADAEAAKDAVDAQADADKKAVEDAEKAAE